VSFHLIQGYPFFGIAFQHALHQILELLCWPLGKLTPEGFRILPEQMVELTGWEWILSHVQHEKTNTE